MYFEALLNVVELMGLPSVALSFSSLSLVSRLLLLPNLSGVM